MLIDKQSLHEAYTAIVDDSLAQGCTVLILVSPEPDSLCACKIFTSLLRSDSVSYEIKPVSVGDTFTDVHVLSFGSRAPHNSYAQHPHYYHRATTT